MPCLSTARPPKAYFGDTRLWRGSTASNYIRPGKVHSSMVSGGTSNNLKKQKMRFASSDPHNDTSI